MSNRVYDAIHKLSKHGGVVNLFDTRGDYLRGFSVIRALSEVGVLYEEQHYSYLHFGSHVGTKFAKRWAKEKYATFNLNDKLDWMVYRFRRGLSIKELVINLNKLENTFFNDNRQYLYWDSDLYGMNYGRRPDPSGSLNPCTEPGSTQVQWETYGYGAGNPLVRLIAPPFQAFVAYFYNYPYKFMGEGRDFINKGLGRLPIGQNAMKYWDDRWNYKSLLPQPGRENRMYYTSREKHRAILKSVYMAENPDRYKTEIKWRHVRRFLRDAKKSLTKYG